MRIVSLLLSLPYVHDSQHWCLQTDLALLAEIFILIYTNRHSSNNTDYENTSSTESSLDFNDNSPLKTRKEEREVDNGKDEASIILSHASAMIYVQFIFFYAAAALFKINDGFLSPKASCAPIYIIQVMYTCRESYFFFQVCFFAVLLTIVIATDNEHDEIVSVSWYT